MKSLLLAIIAILLILLGIFAWTKTKNNTNGTTTTTPQPSEQTAKPSIIVTNPTKNQTVTSSPISITGEATGAWYFEASFPISLKDEAGNVLAQTIGTAQGEWMTEALVPFTALLDYSVTTSTKATLVFNKDNPSGLPENAQQFSVPIVLMPTATKTRTVTLYFYNPDKDKDETNNLKCSAAGLVGVTRIIPITKTPIQDTITLLLKGNPTPTEKIKGITTGFPLQGVTLKGASLKDGVLTLAFADPDNKTSGGSCYSSILWAQIATTAKQFPGVTSVKFTPEELFQP